MKRQFRAAAAASLALSLVFCGGCSIGGSYSSITPHLEQRFEIEDSSELSASSYSALKSAILHLVETGETSGIIKLAEYSGDVQNDVFTACRDIQTGEPLGVYAVEYMSYECVRILTYYEATISITYRRTQEQIDSIVHISSAYDFRGALDSALNDFADELVADVRYYYPEQYDAAKTAEELLLENPLHCVAVPSVSTQVYPDSADSDWNRILDVTLSWELDKDTLTQRLRELHEKAAQMISDLGDTESTRVSNLLARAASNVAPTENSGLADADTTYGALVGGRGSSKGCALALAALCEGANIDWRIVSGTLAGDAHYWNMLRINDNWYHVDLSARGGALPMTTSELSDGYSWSAGAYPACSGPSFSTFAASAQETPAAGE